MKTVTSGMSSLLFSFAMLIASASNARADSTDAPGASAVSTAAQGLGNDDLYARDSGRWLDVGSSIQCDACNHEAFEEALLVVDNFVQDFGMMHIATEVSLPETHAEATSQSAAFTSLYLGLATLRALPFFGKNSAGMRAIATF